MSDTMSLQQRLDYPVPLHMKHLPREQRGYIVPAFVAYVKDGSEVRKDTKGSVPDFRIMRGGYREYCWRFHRCWLCGHPLGVPRTFVIGPMCAINRTSAEPPSHHDCADYAAHVCPFMTNPREKRDTKDLPERFCGPGGEMIDRNPGVVLLWTTSIYKLVPDPKGGFVFRLGNPERVEWFCRGRAATRAEVEASIVSGLPLLEKIARGEGPEAVGELLRMRDEAMPLLPAA